MTHNAHTLVAWTIVAKHAKKLKSSVKVSAVAATRENGELGQLNFGRAARSGSDCGDPSISMIMDAGSGPAPDAQRAMGKFAGRVEPGSSTASRIRSSVGAPSRRNMSSIIYAGTPHASIHSTWKPSHRGSISTVALVGLAAPPAQEGMHLTSRIPFTKADTSGKSAPNVRESATGNTKSVAVSANWSNHDLRWPA